MTASDNEPRRAERMGREKGNTLVGEGKGGGGSMKVNGDVLNTVLGVSGSIKKLYTETGERRGRGEGRGGEAVAEGKAKHAWKRVSKSIREYQRSQ